MNVTKREAERHAANNEARKRKTACTCGIEETPERRAQYGSELHSPYCPVGQAEREAAKR